MPDPGAALPVATADGRARQSALEAGVPPVGSATVGYRSRGRLLIIGPDASALGLVERVPAGLEARVLLTDDAAAQIRHPDVGELGARALRARPLSLRGHLGAFRVEVAQGGGEADLATVFGLEENESFDLVIDLGEPSLQRRQLDPPGYFRPRSTEEATTALQSAGDLVGEFEKPRYFDYNPDICVHGSRGQRGCNACLDACATEAIRSLGEKIEVDPYLCQGCGSCSTVCPSGAIRYAWPSPETLLEYLRGLLRRYREAGGQRPVLLFHDEDDGAAAVAGWAPDLPESVLPVALEDIGSIGVDIWLSGLAYGASRVLLVTAATMPPSERDASAAQITLAGEIVRGLGFPSDRIDTIDPGGRIGPLADVPEPLVGQPAAYAAVGDKREIVRKALLYLRAQAHSPAAIAPLPAGAPWGEVQVDRDACTLCMACVSVCPTQALIGGGERPRLLFREDRCVQCGLCERTCPEDAITLAPRIDFDALAQPEERLRNEEEPHHCPGCGKPFATRKLIGRMQQRLGAHWMFDNDEARRRLELCEDCRLEAILRDEGSINPYKSE